MYRATAACSRPVTKHLAAQTFCLVLASFCVCLLKVRQIATIAPLELLVVMLVGSTWQQFTGRSVYRTGSTALQ